jgi:hypothetical protein
MEKEGVEKEGVEVAPTKPAAAATVEVAVADKMVVEKAGDAPKAPSGIEEERTVEVAVGEEVAVAPALMVAVLVQEMEMTQEQIIQKWCMQGCNHFPVLPPRTSKK